MGLFRATVRSTRSVNGVRLEKGMTVEFVSNYGAPLATNGGKEVIAAFLRQYGVDIEKANAVSGAFIEVVRVR